MQKISFLVLIILSLQFSSCDTRDITKQDSLVKEAINPSELTHLVSEYEVSQEYDAITFFIGYAFQELLSEDPSIPKQLLSDLKVNQYNSLNTLLEEIPTAKKQINNKIGRLLETENAYKDWQNSILRQVKNSDYLSLFNEKVSSYNNKEEFIFYLPDNIDLDKSKTDITIGVDISLPNKDEALIFYENKAVTITLEEAQKLDKNLIFIGINKANIKSNTKVERDWYRVTEKLKKWYHHGKVEWQSCSSQCDVDYEWHTCYRWYSSWKFKESGTLTTFGDKSEFYYSNYRIQIQVTYYGLSNFGIFEKHWANDNWQPVNY